jgi:hypothetical protein
MKIDKVLFSCSEEFSDFWNIVSEIFKTKFNIEPVCLLFGNISNTNMSETYGKIVQFDYIENLPKILQVTWSKFYYTNTEPETTWMIGDIDQLPLNKSWFVDNISKLSDDCYAHLNTSACAENMGLPFDGWLKGLCDLPAHYHVAKGKIFGEFLELKGSLEDQILEITTNKIGSLENLKTIDNHTNFFWCEEERVSSKRLFSKLNTNRIKLFAYNNKIYKICRSRYNFSIDDYIYNEEFLKKEGYVDIHCERPFLKTKNQIEKILKIAWE